MEQIASRYKKKNIDITTLKIEIDELERKIGEINLSNLKTCKINWTKWQPHETTSSFDWKIELSVQINEDKNGVSDDTIDQIVPGNL